jgi:peptidoglycan/xylan/chitin deacetylase (PgdA/CDA1 family)
MRLAERRAPGAQLRPQLRRGLGAVDRRWRWPIGGPCRRRDWSPFGPGERDLAAETSFEYGSRAGFWRITQAFDERRIPLTVFACALALERNPPAARAIAERGYDICCHGWRWVQMFRLSEEQEREHIRLAIASLAKTIGSRPLG